MDLARVSQRVTPSRVFNCYLHICAQISHPGSSPRFSPHSDTFHCLSLLNTLLDRTLTPPQTHSRSQFLRNPSSQIRKNKEILRFTQNLESYVLLEWAGCILGRKRLGQVLGGKLCSLLLSASWWLVRQQRGAGAQQSKKAQLPGRVKPGFRSPSISELRGKKNQTQDKAHSEAEKMTKCGAAEQSLLPEQEPERGQGLWEDESRSAWERPYDRPSAKKEERGGVASRRSFRPASCLQQK